MNKEQKRKLRNISLLALVGLIGGTFAFQAFNQQAINDRLRDNEVEVGGRVHDYYNRDTENKDVFVENYGQEEIMARIRLSEFMEIQRRGQTTFEPVVDDTSRDDVTSWTTWKPEADNINNRQDTDFSDRFDEYSNLTFGWERPDQPEEFAPWYLPTFNLIEDDERTAAAGHARDWAEVGGDEDSVGATNGTTDGATHPGDGADGYWSEGESYNNSAGDWFGSQVTRETAQNLPQERPPMTMDQWENDLDREEKIGDFWVIDQNTGWAYWASKLNPGETSSYLLDAAEMTEQADAINGSYYYGIHVESNLVSPDNREEFLTTEGDEEHHERLADFLEAIEHGAMDDEYTNGGGLPAENPGPEENAGPGDFNFGIMNSGRLFTMNNQRFRYLEDMGDGNHLIIRDSMIPSTTWNAQPTELQNWYDALIQAEPTLESMVQPVTIPNPAPGVPDGSITWTGTGIRWLPANLANFATVADDLTTVATSGGSKQAFALSLADVTKLSQPGGAFSNHAERVTGGQGNNNGWWLRTPGASGNAWGVLSTAYGAAGQLTGDGGVTDANAGRGVRPALILHQ